MWLKCCRCERTTLCIEDVAPSPYRCRSCRETHPDWRPRRSGLELEDGTRVVRSGEFIDAARGGVVIDVTPAG